MQMVCPGASVRWGADAGTKTEEITLWSTASADWLVEDVVLQLATTSGVVMQLNGIAESTCGNNTS